MQPVTEPSLVTDGLLFKQPLEEDRVWHIYRQDLQHIFLYIMVFLLPAEKLFQEDCDILKIQYRETIY